MSRFSETFTSPYPNKRQCLQPQNSFSRNENDGGTSFLSNLNEATTTGGPTIPSKEPEVGDAMQQEAVKLANQGHNLFLTGRAGTGKSWATKRIIEDFARRGLSIHATAPTGIAAINVDGTTIHNWGRFNLGEYYEDFENMWGSTTKDMIYRANALLIDEISMLDGHLLDVLECMVTIIRRYTDVVKIYGSSPHVSDEMLRDRWSSGGLGDIEPWGGLQVIVVGDFFQLPPVPAGQDQLLSMSDEIDLKIGRQGSYAFESYAWMNSTFKTVELTEVHRQDEDDGLYDFLNDLREGHTNDLASKHGPVLKSIQCPLPPRKDGIIPTELHSKNVVVDSRNREELIRIMNKSIYFKASDDVALDYVHYMAPFLRQHNLHLEKLICEGDRKLLHKLRFSDDDKDKIRLSLLAYKTVIHSKEVPKYAKKTLENDMNELRQHSVEHFFSKSCRVAEHFELKKDAQVMLLWNLDVKGGLANGSRGIVKGFFPTDGYLFLLEEELKRREEENNKLNESDRNENASREANNNTDPEENHVIKPELVAPLEVYDFSKVDQGILNEVRDIVKLLSHDTLEKETEEMETIVSSNIADLPYIQFTNGIKRLIRPQSFSKTFKKCGTAMRWQIPLTLAWAVTIHKSQGMTIDLLFVDLSDCFADGQAYVACSRGRSVKSMQVVKFKPSVVKASKKVILFYQLLKQGKPYRQTWADSIDEFDRGIREQLRQKKEMEKAYSNSSCDLCGHACVVRKIFSSRNNNKGKWFMSCPIGSGAHSGHTWKLLGFSPPKPKPKAESMCKISTPESAETKTDSLDGQRFVLTGVFPTLGGGDGLTLGKDKLKQIITSFGGAVTGSISGKTNFVVVGEEPGAKKLEQAKSRGVKTIDLSALLKMTSSKAEKSDCKIKVYEV